jgi:hypothetical protein
VVDALDLKSSLFARFQRDVYFKAKEETLARPHLLVSFG